MLAAYPIYPRVCICRYGNPLPKSRFFTTNLCRKIDDLVGGIRVSSTRAIHRSAQGGYRVDIPWLKPWIYTPPLEKNYTPPLKILYKPKSVRALPMLWSAKQKKPRKYLIKRLATSPCEVISASMTKWSLNNYKHLFQQNCHKGHLVWTHNNVSGHEWHSISVRNH